MLDLETQLRRYANDLDRRYPDVTFEEIVGVVVQPALVGQPPGPDGPPGLTRSVASALAPAAVVLVVVGAVVLLAWMFRTDPPPVITEPTVVTDEGETSPAGSNEGPLGMIVTGRFGIALVPFDPSDQPIMLESDELYRGIEWAMSDNRGGLIFTHRATPPPWPPGSVLWLRAGAVTPELLVPGGPGLNWRIGMATSRDGGALFVYTADEPDLTIGNTIYRTSRIMVADLDDDGSTRELVQLDGSAGWEYRAFTGGDVVVVLENVEGCPPVTVLSVEDGTPIPTGIDCIPYDDIPKTASHWYLSHDGRSVGMIRTKWLDGEGVSIEGVTVTDLLTGEIIEEGTIDAGGGHGHVDLISGPSGWLILVRDGYELRLVGLDGVERLRFEWPGLSMGFSWLELYHQPFELAPSASLGSGSTEAPCQPSSAGLPPQDLPAPVASTRQLLFDLAASCDYQGLAALALEHGPHVFVDRNSGGLPPYSEETLIEEWVSHGQTGSRWYNFGSREPLASLAALLATHPAYVEDIRFWPVFEGPNLDQSGCVWVWPAVYVAADGGPGDREVWREHYSYRIGIGADGTWRFFMTGFHEPPLGALRPPPCGDD